MTQQFYLGLFKTLLKGEKDQAVNRCDMARCQHTVKKNFG